MGVIYIHVFLVNQEMFLSFELSMALIVMNMDSLWTVPVSFWTAEVDDWRGVPL